MRGCPFCQLSAGHKPEVVYEYGVGNYVRCGCSARGPIHELAAGAIIEWNNRYAHPRVNVPTRHMKKETQ